MLWPKGIGLDCCYVGVAFLQQVMQATCIFDPFAGRGTVLAMAGELGLEAIGIELSPKRCRKAQALSVRNKMHLIAAGLRNIALDVTQLRQKTKLGNSSSSSGLEASAVINGSYDDEDDNDNDDDDDDDDDEK